MMPILACLSVGRDTPQHCAWLSSRTVERVQSGTLSLRACAAVSSGFNRASAANNRRSDVDHAEGPGHTVVLGHSHVLACHEQVFVEAKDRLVVVIAWRIGERPAPVAALNEDAVLVGRVIPEAPHGACGLELGPAGGVKVALGIQWRNEFVAVRRTAFGKVRGPCQFQVDALKAHESLRVRWPV